MSEITNLYKTIATKAREHLGAGSNSYQSYGIEVPIEEVILTKDSITSYQALLYAKSFVVDIENKDNSFAGIIYWNELVTNCGLSQYAIYENSNLQEYPTFIVKTKNNGFHIYFNLEKGSSSYKELENRINENIELKHDKITMAYSCGQNKLGEIVRYAPFNFNDVADLPVELLPIFKKKKKDKVVTEKSDKKNLLSKFPVEEIQAHLEKVLNDTSSELEYEVWISVLHQFYFFCKQAEELGVTECDMDWAISTLNNWSLKSSKYNDFSSTTISNIAKNFDYNIQLRDYYDKHKKSSFCKVKKEKETFKYTNSFSNNTIIESLNIVFEDNKKLKYLELAILELLKEKSYMQELESEGGKNAPNSRDWSSFNSRCTRILAESFVNDIKDHQESFIVHTDKIADTTEIRVFTKERTWSKLFSVRNNISSLATFNMATPLDDFLEYHSSDYFYRKDILSCLAKLLPTQTKAMHTLSDAMFATVYFETDLIKSLRPKNAPLNYDICVFSNVILKIKKTFPFLEKMEVKDLHGLKCLTDFRILKSSKDAPDLTNKTDSLLPFDTQLLDAYCNPETNKKCFETISSNVFNTLGFMFWTYFPDYNGKLPKDLDRSNPDYHKIIAKYRMRYFFACLGKSMIGFKGGSVPMNLMISGDSKRSSAYNGHNGKSFMAEVVIPRLFGKAKVATKTQDLKDNDSTFSNTNMDNVLLAIYDDPSVKRVDVGKILKDCGEREVYVKTKFIDNAQKLLKNDNLLIANEFNRNLKDNMGTKRRIAYIEFLGSKTLFPDIYNEEDLSLADGIQETISYVQDSLNDDGLYQEVGNSMLEFLNHCSASFEKQNISHHKLFKTDIFDSKFRAAKLLYGFESQSLENYHITYRSSLFIYCIINGLDLIRKDDFSKMYGYENFIIKDGELPIANTFNENVKVDLIDTKSGLYLSKNHYQHLISHVLLDNFDFKKSSDAVEYVRNTKTIKRKVINGREHTLVYITDFDFSNLANSLKKLSEAQIGFTVNNISIPSIINLIKDIQKSDAELSVEKYGVLLKTLGLNAERDIDLLNYNIKIFKDNNYKLSWLK